MALTTRPLTPALWDAWRALFAAHEAFTWCRCTYWDFRGDNRAWIRRTADENERLRESGLAELRGVLAFEGATPVGWARLQRRTADDKLAATYGPPAPDTWAVTCFAVAPKARGRGCARALLAAAVDHARALGARRLEGYPRPPEPDPFPDGEAWTGPAAVFAGAGFTLQTPDPHRCIASLAL